MNETGCSADDGSINSGNEEYDQQQYSQQDNESFSDDSKALICKTNNDNTIKRLNDDVVASKNIFDMGRFAEHRMIDPMRNFRPSSRKLLWILFISICLFFLFYLGHMSHSSSSSIGDVNILKLPLTVDSEIPKPFSMHSPMELSMFAFDRPVQSKPGPVYGKLSKGALETGVALPTNTWYQNLLLVDANNPVLNENHRVYTLPYIIDFCGTIPGLRIHSPNAVASDTVVQMTYIPQHGLTLGKNGTKDNTYILLEKENDQDPTPFTPLSVHLKWGPDPKWDDDESYMTTSLIRGMPYATMIYKGNNILIASEITLGSNPIIDGAAELDCSLGNATKIERDVKLYFKESDFTWIVFFSHPVLVQCLAPDEENVDGSDPKRSAFELQVLQEQGEEDLVVRMALLNNCTNGNNPSYCNYGQSRDASEYEKLLREHSSIYPYDPEMRFKFPEESHHDNASSDMTLKFNWGVKNMFNKTENKNEENDDPIMFALPHHVKMIADKNLVLGHCTSSLHGPACLIRGQEWELIEDLGPTKLSFTAPRVPHHSAIPAMAQAIENDIQYELPSYYMRGAGDTYFSGKMLAKLGRIIAITDELKKLVTSKYVQQSNDSTSTENTDREINLEMTIKACQNVTFPSDGEITQAIARLRAGVQIWLERAAETKMVYDKIYGGLVSCGCWFNSEESKCDNVFPNCPSFEDIGLDFGHGFFNDHHFHQGYHIYAAAIVASFDHEWGRKYFEHVLLLIRDIANPSTEDKFFPLFRHKDWFLGNSWASGIATLGGQPYPNGRNQESSSEAIAAYEGIAMYGTVMVKAWGDGKSDDPLYNQNAGVARSVRNFGRLLMATELRAADQYWHVRDYNANSTSQRVYPPQYTPYAVGMMWNTMAQFQTWFGNDPFLAYGIQLMPLTPVSERNFEEEWIRQLYPSFASTCEAHSSCAEEGWSILQYAVLATIGQRDQAMKKVQELSNEVFMSAGGNGHSLTNTLWYIATRPPSTKWVPVPNNIGLDCGCPESCTLDAQNKDAGGFSCKERIQWLVKNKAMPEVDACKQVGATEYPQQCGSCDPDQCKPATIPTSASIPENGEEEAEALVCGCPKTCTKIALENPANGYSCKDHIKWLMDVNGETELVACSLVGGKEFRKECGACDPDRCVAIGSHEQTEADGNCPPCSKEICLSSLNRCPVHDAPYLCHIGLNKGGCSPVPWILNDYDLSECIECCKLFPHCSA